MKNGFLIISENMSIKHFVGEFLADPVCGDHCHDKYEITYLISASGNYRVEGSEVNVNQGDLLLIHPMSYHKVIFDTDQHIEGYTLYFSRSALSDGIASVLDSLSAETGSLGAVFPGERLSDTLLSIFGRFEESKKLRKHERQIYIQALISEIIILLSAVEGEAIMVSDDELGARVAAYINSNIERNISLERLARRFFVSKYYLCRAFKSFAGISPHAYINQKRILHAKGLIESGMTASKAAERVGFGDYSAFYRAYTKIVGKSPTSE